MVTQPAYLKNLKTYARQQSGTLEDVPAAVADAKNESDRGLVILAATGIEDVLEMAISRKLPTIAIDDKLSAEIFGSEKPLSTFSRKITMAYAMGIIDAAERKQVDLIREMRNACAHARLPMSFARPELEACALVVIADALPRLKARDPKILREAFNVQCHVIMQNIIYERKQTFTQAVDEMAALRSAGLQP